MPIDDETTEVKDVKTTKEVKPEEHLDTYDKNVEDKLYNQSQVIVPDNLIIPEQTIERPQVQFNKSILNPTNTTNSSEVKPEGEKLEIKEEKTKVSAKDKKGSIRMADAIMFLYAKTKEITYNISNLELQKLEQRALKGKFDLIALEVQIPISEVKTISVKKWLDNYNFELKKALSINPVTGKVELTDEKWIGMRDDLAEILADNGFVMSAKEEFFFNLAMDLIETYSMVLGLRMDANRMLNSVSELLKQQNIRGQLFNMANAPITVQQVAPIQTQQETVAPPPQPPQIIPQEQPQKVNKINVVRTLDDGESLANMQERAENNQKEATVKTKAQPTVVSQPKKETVKQPEVINVIPKKKRERRLYTPEQLNTND